MKGKKVKGKKRQLILQGQHIPEARNLVLLYGTVMSLRHLNLFARASNPASLWQCVGFRGGIAISAAFSERIRKAIISVNWLSGGFSLVCFLLLCVYMAKVNVQAAIRPAILKLRNSPSGGDNEIWSFGGRNYLILKNLIELREKLRPYIMKDHGAVQQRRRSGYAPHVLGLPGRRDLLYP